MTDRNELQRTRSGKLITRKVYGEIEEIIDEVDAKFQLFKEKKCDRTPDTPSDHRFVLYKLGGLKEVLSGSSSRKKINLEWENLNNNLQGSSIFVRAYEGRIDLMRAVIVGPPGSPYEHGLFFFDIFLPWNYPTTPARIFYRTCAPDNFDVLFLKFQTWYDRVLDRDDEPVSILDILLVIQKLFSRPSSDVNKTDQTLEYSEMDESSHDSVLNDKDPTQGVVALELQRYDKMDFLFTCRKIICDLREPPKDFKDFVAGYYRQMGHSVLLNLKENMDVSDELMVLLFKGLYEAFRNNGSYVGHYQGFLETLKEQEKSSADSERAKLNKCWKTGAIWESRTLMDFLKLI